MEKSAAMEQASETQAAPKRVRVTEFRANLQSVLREVKAGSSFLLTSHDEIVAELRPYAPIPRLPREPGALRGQIIMAPDFDTWPDEIQAAFDAGLEEDLIS